MIRAIFLATALPNNWELSCKLVSPLGCGFEAGYSGNLWASVA